jgi:hypothetical protein
VDYLCLAALLLAIVASVVLPILHRMKKKKMLLERLAVDNPDAAAILKK